MCEANKAVIHLSFYFRESLMYTNFYTNAGL